MSLLTNLRDKAVESFIRNNEWVKKFADIQSVYIDSKSLYADVLALLHGEKEPIRFRAYYAFDIKDSETILSIKKITCERLWIDTALDTWVNNRDLKFPLPKIAGSIAKIIF